MFSGVYHRLTLYLKKTIVIYIDFLNSSEDLFCDDSYCIYKSFFFYILKDPIYDYFMQTF